MLPNAACCFTRRNGFLTVQSTSFTVLTGGKLEEAKKLDQIQMLLIGRKLPHFGAAISAI